MFQIARIERDPDSGVRVTLRCETTGATQPLTLSQDANAYPELKVGRSYQVGFHDNGTLVGEYG